MFNRQSVIKAVVTGYQCKFYFISYHLCVLSKEVLCTSDV